MNVEIGAEVQTSEEVQLPTEESQTTETTDTPEAIEKTESEKMAEQDEQKEEAESDVAVENSKLQELEIKLTEALKMGEKANSLAKTVEDLTGEIESKKTVIGEYESLLQTVVDGKMKNVPEEYHELIPTNMGLKEKLEWLEKAESKGLFNKQEKEHPAIEIGKPMNVDVPKVDSSKMSASDLMKMAYNTIKR